MGTSRFDERYPLYNSGTISNADGTNLITVQPNGNGVHRIDAVYVATDSALALVVRCWAPGPSVPAVLGSTSIPALQGTAGTKGVEVFRSLLATPDDGILLSAGDAFYISLETALVSGHTLWWIALGGLY